MSQEMEISTEENGYVVMIPGNKHLFRAAFGNVAELRLILKAAEARGYRLCEEARQEAQPSSDPGQEPMIGN